MSTSTTVKEAVKESLLGSEEPAKLSSSHRASFLNNAIKDEQTGELYMGPEEFISAIAPPGQDYVSYQCLYQPMGIFMSLTFTHFCSTKSVVTSMVFSFV